MMRRFRTLAAALCAGLVTMAIATPNSHAATSTPPPWFVQLQGEGAWSVWQQTVPWQNELATAASPIDFNYVRRGSFLGREDLIDGNVDYAISGVGFSSDELAKLKHGAADLISAPIQVASLATIVEPQYYYKGPGARYITQMQICDPDADPSTWPPGITRPDQCLVDSEYTGPVRLPTRNLAAMYTRYQTPGEQPPFLSSWNSPDILKAFGFDPATTTFAVAGLGQGPAVSGRSDPDETNYMLNLFIKSTNPDIWASIGGGNPTERLTKIVGVTRDGAEEQVGQLAHDGCGVTGSGCSDVFADSGAIAAAPASAILGFRSTYPGLRVDLAQLQNANGDWVAPTPDSINKAVDAGGDQPLWALDHKIPGAYPLVWVDRLYAPAHGLSVAKTEGLAMLIRYLATTGQEKNQAVGEGRLSQPLVSQALAAANQLVASNCVGSDRKIVTNDTVGPLAPASATAMRSLTNIQHCVAVPKPATTTTSPASSNFGGSSSGGFNGASGDFANGSNSSSDGGTSSPSAANGGSNTSSGTNSSDSGGTGATSPNAKTISQLLTATNLPIPAPTGESGADRLGRVPARCGAVPVVAQAGATPVDARERMTALDTPNVARPSVSGPSTDASSRSPEKRSSVASRRVIRTGLLALVVLGAFYGLFALFEGPFAQWWNHTRQHQLAAQLQSATKHTGKGRAIAVFQVPSLGINQIVAEGDTPEQLRSGPAHRMDTPLPGAIGNSVITGHRSGWGGPLDDLAKVAVGDPIVVQTLDNNGIPVNGVYKVVSTRTVGSNDLSPFGGSTDHRVTIVTGTGGQYSDRRLVVTAVSGTVGKVLPPKPGTVATTSAGNVWWGRDMLLVVLGLGSALLLGLVLRKRYHPAAVLAVVAPLAAIGLLGIFLNIDSGLPPFR